MQSALHILLHFVVSALLGALAGWGLAVLDTRLRRRKGRPRVGPVEKMPPNSPLRPTLFLRSRRDVASGTDVRPAVP
jgi:hypothetical protein